MRSRSVWASTFVAVGVLIGAACSGSNGDSDRIAELEAEIDSLRETEQQLREQLEERSDAEPNSTEPVSTEPDVTEPAATTTTSTSTTTTSTTEPPPTTIDAGLEADAGALFVLESLAAGEATDLVDAFVSDLEPFPLDRVDVISGVLNEDNTGYLIVVGRSGFGTEEFQREALVDTLTILTDVWDTDPFAGLGNIKVGLDLTVDGRQVVLENQTMLDLLNRRITPEQALGS